MSYTITDYTKKRAKEINVEVKPSTNPKKKVDVYRDGIKIDSIGAIGYSDYSTYIKDKGREFADKRRDLYHQRHQEETLGGLLAKWLLW
jgi:hypothetical protein